MQRVRRNFRSARWLTKTNRYATNLLERFHKDARSKRVKESALREYIAASGPVHIIDGWSYLGRAADALLKGDPSTSIHLAYYAELRAAVAMLGLDGIGLFSAKHAVVQSTGQIKLISDKNKKGGTKGTHAFVWPALDWWSRPKSVQALLLGALGPGQTDIWTWLSSFQAGTSGAAIGREWLRIWGLDLRQLSKDHFARNEVSYRPSRFRGNSNATTQSAVTFVTALWQLLEPSTGGRFDNLDRYLLRIAIEIAFRGVSGSPPSAAPDRFERDVELMLRRVGAEDDNAIRWSRFLRRLDHPTDPRPIIAASERTYSTDEESAIQVMSRAALLLRLAIASAQEMLRSAGILQESLAFWWHQFGIERGFWRSGKQPASASDCWEDIRTCIEDANNWCNTADPSVSLMDFRDDNKWPTLSLGSFELISIWGLAS